MDIKDISKAVVHSALENEKEVLEEEMLDIKCPHKYFDKRVLLAVINEKLLEE